MQAYATAEPKPPTVLSPSQARPTTELAEAQPGHLLTAAGERSIGEGASAALASLLVDSIDDHWLAVLARRLQPHLRDFEQTDSSHVAYTVASLAAELDVSPKTLRAAIARRELRAIKRGARWIISAEAVSEWASAPQAERATSRRRRAIVPKAAGPSLRSVLCGEAPAPTGVSGRAR